MVATASITLVNPLRRREVARLRRERPRIAWRADNILRTDEGIHVIDYKRRLRDVITSNTASVLEDHLDGTDHDPKRVKNVFQAATYIEGIKQSDLYEDGMNIRFSFYGLLNHTSFEKYTRRI